MCRRSKADGSRSRLACGAKLPLPLGEGGGEGGRASRRSPHPRFARPLPEGEVRHCALRDRLLQWKQLVQVSSAPKAITTRTCPTRSRGHCPSRYLASWLRRPPISTYSDLARPPSRTRPRTSASQAGREHELLLPDRYYPGARSCSVTTGRAC